MSALRDKIRALAEEYRRSRRETRKLIEEAKREELFAFELFVTRCHQLIESRDDMPENKD